MKKHLPVAISIIAILVVLLASFFALHIFPADAATSHNTNRSASPLSFESACPPPSEGEARCQALVSTTTLELTQNNLQQMNNPGTVVTKATATGSQDPYGPAALHKAYNLPTKANTHQTVAIVDPFDDPKAEQDMNTYRSMFGISPCTTANGCFQKVDQTGGTNFPTPNARTGREISIDLDMVSAICQNCHILLVEADSRHVSDLGQAENEAVALGANEVSNSFGGPENSADAQICDDFFNHPGVAITVASGDEGSPVLENPADCPNVVSVGGTTLHPDGTETAWNTSPTLGAGGGCSAVFDIPSWQAQATTHCANRAVADVSADADKNTGVLVIDTFGIAGHGQLEAGGTSVSAPIIAGVYALAGGIPKDATSGASIPWSKITAGKQCLNKVGGKTYAFQTGLGTPNGLGCF